MIYVCNWVIAIDLYIPKGNSIKTINNDSKSSNSNYNSNVNNKSFSDHNSDEGYDGSYVLLIQAFLRLASKNYE